MVAQLQHGILLLDKRSGITSARAISEVKRLIHPDRIGHAGTLDPMATGLLVCLIGSATRFASFAAHGNKIYSGTIQFGLVTDSDDITGAVLEEREVNFNSEQMLHVAKSLTGTIQQVPPRVSAIKIQGRKSYDLARAGSQHEMVARTVQILRFDLKLLSSTVAEFEVECSGGTYIRSLARDLGAKHTCGATLASLRREASAPFNVQDAVTIERLTSDAIRDVRELLPGAPSIELTAAELVLAEHGDERLFSQISERILNALGNAANGLVLLVTGNAGNSSPTRGAIIVEEGTLKFGPMLRER